MISSLDENEDESQCILEMVDGMNIPLDLLALR